MTNKQLPAEVQLPKEVGEQIKKDAEVRATHRPNTTYHRGFKDGEIFGATAYATKLHETVKALQESDKQRKESNDELREAKKLLNEVCRKHEAGLLPDRFIYEKIKSFLYGE